MAVGWETVGINASEHYMRQQMQQQMQERQAYLERSMRDMGINIAEEPPKKAKAKEKTINRKLLLVA